MYYRIEYIEFDMVHGFRLDSLGVLEHMPHRKGRLLFKIVVNAIVKSKIIVNRSFKGSIHAMTLSLGTPRTSR